ncbi:MAG: hypothetical protein WHT06_08425 [Desulfobacterales bacterium]
MLFLLLGAVLFAVACSSNRFPSGGFFTAGTPACLLLLAVPGLMILFIWPIMGMAVLAP